MWFRRIVLKEPVLNRRQRDWTSNLALLCFNLGGCTGDQRQLRDRLVVKEMFGWESQSRLVLARHYLERQYRLTTEREEVIVCTDRLDAQHFRPDSRERLLRFA